MKKVLAGAFCVLFLLVGTVGAVEQPPSFDKVRAIVDRDGVEAGGLKLIDVMMPDVVNEDNIDGKINLIAGYNTQDGKIGLLVGFITSEGDPIALVGVFYYPKEGRLFFHDSLKDVDTDIDIDKAEAFIEAWLKLYNIALGAMNV